MKPLKPWSTKSLDIWQAKSVYPPVCTDAVIPTTHKHHSTGGRMCWLSVLQIPQWPQILLRPHSTMLLAWHDSPVPLLPVKPERILLLRGFDFLACLVGLCGTHQRKPTSLCLLLAPVTEWEKTDEHGAPILFPRAPHHSGNRHPESGIPFLRLSTIHRQGAMNLKFWCRNCWCITPCVTCCSSEKWTE